ncbi:MAG: hypothetical protein H6737_30885 [Alphaproteobacteria bacterium]|nr:hypothetical protein [Alphaproteobacteria bacterium]
MRLIAILVALVGCKKDGVVVTDSDEETGTPVAPGDVGDPCQENDDCFGELVCSNALLCAQPNAPGTTPFGEDCFTTSECQAGLVCDHGETCAAAGGPGTSGIGQACTTADDCQSALSCYEDVCIGFEMPRWEGIECPGSDPPFRVHFEVPRGPAGHLDYFRLPFPNDIRVSGGTVDIAEYPVSGFGFLGSGDISAGIVASYGTAFPGFGPNQPVILRTATYPTFDTVLVGLPGEGSVSLVDITEGTPQYGTRHPTGWKVTSGVPYMCDPWVSLYPSVGRPFLANHTYAAVITTDLLGDSGVVPVQDPDFAAMLGGPPSDSALSSAYAAYAPFRSWLTSAGIQPSSIAGAAVFTIMDPSLSATRIRDVVRGSAAPVASQVVECTTLPGPHADPTDATRGCFGESTDFHEIQGTLGVPHFQIGTAPFKTPDRGGSADWSTGQPAIQSTASVTFSVTVPRGTPPAGGWPVVLFAHDHAGNYRSFVEDGLAAELTDVLLDNGTHVGFAVVSIDTWMTGPRRGAEDAAWLAVDPAGWEPTVLYNSPLNPMAARDNLTQSAADWFQVVRYLETQPWSDAVASPTGEATPLDLTHVYFVGHGIGGAAGPMVVSREDAVNAGVFASTGAFWSSIVADTTAPVALAGYLAPALGDSRVDRFQPLLALGQGIVDRTDPLNQARFIHADVAVPDKHVLQVVSYGDPWAPDEAQYALARGLVTTQVVQSGQVPLDNIDQVSAPVTSNIGAATAVTVVNSGADPHRLLFDDVRTRVQVREFLGTAVRDGTPTVPLVP